MQDSKKPAIGFWLLAIVVIISYALLGIAAGLFAAALAMLVMKNQVRMLSSNSEMLKLLAVYICFLVVAAVLIFLLAYAIIIAGPGANATNVQVAGATQLAGLIEIVVALVVFVYLWRMGTFKCALKKPAAKP